MLEFIEDFESFYNGIMVVIGHSDQEQELSIERWWQPFLSLDKADVGGLLCGYIEALESDFKRRIAQWPEMPGILPKKEQADLAAYSKQIKEWYAKKDDLIFAVEIWQPDKDGWPESLKKDFARDLKVEQFREDIKTKREKLPALMRSLEHAFIVIEQKKENAAAVDKWIKAQNESEGAAFVQSFYSNIDKYKSAIKSNI